MIYIILYTIDKNRKIWEVYTIKINLIKILILNENLKKIVKVEIDNDIK